MILQPRQQELMRLLWNEGPLSRWQLHERSGLTPNGAGSVITSLLSSGLVRECPAEPSHGGRPRIPVEIDPVSRHIVGLVLEPGRAEVGRISLSGQLLGRIQTKTVEQPTALVTTAARLLKSVLSKATLAVGVSVPGFVNRNTRTLLFSSAIVGRPSASLVPLYAAGGDLPLLLENDMHAIAARWLLTHRAESSEDVLIVHIADGMLGAGMLIGGQPNRGCITAANELGHTRLPVETARCYCGHTGCLERICSTEFLRQLGGARHKSFSESAETFDGHDAAFLQMLHYLALALANSINFVRPHRLVLVTELARYPQARDCLLGMIRSLIIRELVNLVRTEVWDQPVTWSAETAAWIALAALYCDHWTPHDVAPMSSSERRTRPWPVRT